MGLASMAVFVLGAAGVAVAGEKDTEDVVRRVGRTRWTGNNSARLLAFPTESWEARLELVRRAKHHVFISTFSWHNDDFGAQFRMELAKVTRQRRRTNPDFEVFILVDSTARGPFDLSFSMLEEAGAKVKSFNRGSWGMSPLYEGRMHDKMIIVDGRWAIVSGRNFANEYFDPRRWWLDFGVLLEGDAVWDLQMHFLKAWETTLRFSRPHRFFLPEATPRREMRSLWRTGRFRNGDSPLEKYLTAEYFPPVNGRPGPYRVAVLYDNSLVRRPASSTELLIELIEGAEHEVDLMTPFPNFPPELTQALVAAITRGVRLRIFVNSAEAAIRGGFFLLAGLPTVIQLQEAGAEVWEWSGNGDLERQLERLDCNPETLPPKALHAKMARIDEEITIVHSSNFNIRSTYYNTEAGVVVLDTAFNRSIRELLDGLVDLRDLRVACEEGFSEIAVERVVSRVDAGRLSELREHLGGKQPFLDAMGVLW